jgi:hypothetical protein
VDRDPIGVSEGGFQGSRAAVEDATDHETYDEAEITTITGGGIKEVCHEF